MSAKRDTKQDTEIKKLKEKLKKLAAKFLKVQKKKLPKSKYDKVQSRLVKKVKGSNTLKELERLIRSLAQRPISSVVTAPKETARQVGVEAAASLKTSLKRDLSAPIKSYNDMKAAAQDVLKKYNDGTYDVKDFVNLYRNTKKFAKAANEYIPDAQELTNIYETTKDRLTFMRDWIQGNLRKGDTPLTEIRNPSTRSPTPTPKPTPKPTPTPAPTPERTPTPTPAQPKIRETKSGIYDYLADNVPSASQLLTPLIGVGVAAPIISLLREQTRLRTRPHMRRADRDEARRVDAGTQANPETQEFGTQYVREAENTRAARRASMRDPIQAADEDVADFVARVDAQQGPPPGMEVNLNPRGRQQYVARSTNQRYRAQQMRDMSNRAQGMQQASNAPMQDDDDLEARLAALNQGLQAEYPVPDDLEYNYEV